MILVLPGSRVQTETLNGGKFGKEKVPLETRNNRQPWAGMCCVAFGGSELPVSGGVSAKAG